MSIASVGSTPRTGALPAPPARRAGDYVFVSSIHPIGDDGEVVRAPFAYVGESEMAVQTRHVLETLQRTLEDAGSSVDRVLKAEVHLSDAADFHEFKLVWKEMFPVDPPARTTLVVGDNHIHAGCLLNLHAVALHETSSYDRTVINPAGAPDPLDAEAASWAVKAGPLVFVSAFPASDFKTGLAVGRRPGFPNYGSDAEMQAIFLVDVLEQICADAGTSLGNAVKCQFYETDLQTFHEVDAVWGARMGVPPPRSSMACMGFVVPGAEFASNVIFLVPDAEHEKAETRAGIRWHPVDVRKVNFSPGITAGPWLFTAGQVPVPDFAKPEWVGAPKGLPHYFSDIEIQTGFTLELLKEQLEANGHSFADVVDARIYLVDVHRDFRGFARAWQRAFADVEQWPTMSMMPSNQADGDTGIMFPGPTIEIDLISRREG
jgi:enamine deaminase RidA (YjgF/YER057c/UK114 family)